jgi:four helix bundle protein
MKSTSYRDLDVWKKAISLAKSVYQITDNFPKRELYGMTNQIRRCVISIAANIAEGQARNSKKEFKYFLGISLGSVAELETILTIAREVKYVSDIIFAELLSSTDEITRMIKGLVKHISE